MCELGLQGAEKNLEVRDPHVFSNMNPSRFLVVGQNPGWDELKQHEPFVGAAGKNFDAEIAKHGLDRKSFYISNTVRCHTKDNQKPTPRHMDRCEPFLRMEIGLLKPKLVITLGAVAFAQFCPNNEYSKSLKTIIKSEKFDVPVFAVYHPSPMNFRDEHRKIEFAKQVHILCTLLKRIK
jgi:DNA polymerase